MKGRKKESDSLRRSRVLFLVGSIERQQRRLALWLLDRVDDVGTDLFVAFQL
jgi:hypothetical protein